MQLHKQLLTETQKQTFAKQMAREPSTLFLIFFAFAHENWVIGHVALIQQLFMPKKFGPTP